MPEPSAEWLMVELGAVHPIAELGKWKPATRSGDFQTRSKKVEQGRLSDDSADGPAPEISVLQPRIVRTSFVPDHIKREGEPAKKHSTYDFEPQVRSHARTGLVRLPARSFRSSEGHRKPSLFILPQAA